MQHKMVLNITFVGEILMCDHSKSNYWVVLSPIVLLIMLPEANITFYFFKLMDEIAKPHCSIQIKTSEKYFPLVGFRGWEKGKN